MQIYKYISLENHLLIRFSPDPRMVQKPHLALILPSLSSSLHYLHFKDASGTNVRSNLIVDCSLV